MTSPAGLCASQQACLQVFLLLGSCRVFLLHCTSSCLGEQLYGLQATGIKADSDNCAPSWFFPPVLCQVGQLIQQVLGIHKLLQASIPYSDMPAQLLSAWLPMLLGVRAQAWRCLSCAGCFARSL